MEDREFLMWIHARLTEVHGEDPLCDYMHRLRSIIRYTPAGRRTPNVDGMNSLEDLKQRVEVTET